MGFVANMFTGSQGSGFQAQGANILQPTTTAQAEQAYAQSQNALAQQQAFANAAGAQNGLANQSNVYSQLQGVASGQGPNPAQAMLNQQTGQNVSNQAALMGSQRGASQNVGMMARQAAQQGANLQQQAVGQGATMQAQQQLGALGQMGSLAGQQVGQQQQAIGTLNQAQQSEQQALLGGIQGQNAANVGMQSNMNSANAAIAQGNQAAQSGILNSVTGGMGTLLSAAGKAVTAAHGGEIGYPDGGMVQGTNPAVAPTTIPSPTDMSGPQSFVGKFLKNTQNTQQNAQANTNNAPSNNLQTIKQNTQNASSSLATGLAGLGSGLYQGVKGLAGGDVGMANGGNIKDLQAKGGHVPGKAKVKGDSFKNDIVSAKLSPGEVVIPRSVMQSKNPTEGAARFVAGILAKHGGNHATQ